MIMSLKRVDFEHKQDATDFKVRVHFSTGTHHRFNISKSISFFWWNEGTSRKKWKRAKTQEMQRTTIVYCQRALRRNKCRGSYGRNPLNMSKLSLELKPSFLYVCNPENPIICAF